MVFAIEYSPDALVHLKSITKRDQQILVDGIEQQLKHQPNVATRKRKKLRPNLLADWELRLDDFRVYYIVEQEPDLVVTVIAMGRKVRNRVFIAGVEIKL